MLTTCFIRGALPRERKRAGSDSRHAKGDDKCKRYVTNKTPACSDGLARDACCQLSLTASSIFSVHARQPPLLDHNPRQSSPGAAQQAGFGIDKPGHRAQTQQRQIVQAVTQAERDLAPGHGGRDFGGAMTIVVRDQAAPGITQPGRLNMSRPGLAGGRLGKCQGKLASHQGPRAGRHYPEPVVVARKQCHGRGKEAQTASAVCTHQGAPGQGREPQGDAPPDEADPPPSPPGKPPRRQEGEHRAQQQQRRQHQWPAAPAQDETQQTSMAVPWCQSAIKVGQNKALTDRPERQCGFWACTGCHQGASLAIAAASSGQANAEPGSGEHSKAKGVSQRVKSRRQAWR